MEDSLNKKLDLDTLKISLEKDLNFFDKDIIILTSIFPNHGGLL